MSLYRLLRHGERIQIGDEVLQDDCETWRPIVGWEAGINWNSVMMVPMRRRMDRDPAPPQPEGDAP